MLSWPGQVESGRVQDLAHAIDLLPTISAAAGLEVADKLPGINLLDKQARANRKRVFGVCHSVYNMTPGNPDGALQYLWVVENKWKLLLRFSGLDTTRYRQLHIWDKEPVRLYDLQEDPHEKNELSALHPEIVTRLKKAIRAWHPAPSATPFKPVE